MSDQDLDRFLRHNAPQVPRPEADIRQRILNAKQQNDPRRRFRMALVAAGVFACLAWWTVVRQAANDKKEELVMEDFVVDSLRFSDSATHDFGAAYLDLAAAIE